jgi:hypothetical protein
MIKNKKSVKIPKIRGYATRRTLIMQYQWKISSSSLIWKCSKSSDQITNTIFLRVNIKREKQRSQFCFILHIMARKPATFRSSSRFLSNLDTYRSLEFNSLYNIYQMTITLCGIYWTPTSFCYKTNEDNTCNTNRNYIYLL